MTEKKITSVYKKIEASSVYDVALKSPLDYACLLYTSDAADE